MLVPPSFLSRQTFKTHVGIDISGIFSYSIGENKKQAGTIIDRTR